MKTNLLLCTLALPLLSAAPRARGTELRYAPKAGTKITRTFTNPGQRTLASMKLVLGGEEHPTGEMEMTETFDQKIVLEDELVEVGKGWPTKLRRTFAEMSQSSTEKASMGERHHEKSDARKSDLADSTVVFTWDAEKEEYQAAFDGKGHDDSLLADLVADVDLSGVLPGQAVSEGDEWTVDTAAFKSGILQPGGEMRFHGDEPQPEAERQVGKDMFKAIRGDVHARFRGTREVEGAKVGVIELKAELSGDIEAAADEKRRGDEGTSISFRQEFEGELLWDVERNRARSYKLEATGSLSLKTHLAFEANEEKIEGEQEWAYDVKETYAGVFAVAE
jgi:hypothetical protein